MMAHSMLLIMLKYSTPCYLVVKRMFFFLNKVFHFYTLQGINGTESWNHPKYNSHCPVWCPSRSQTALVGRIHSQLPYQHYKTGGQKMIFITSWPAISYIQVLSSGWKLQLPRALPRYCPTLCTLVFIGAVIKDVCGGVTESSFTSLKSDGLQIQP